MSTPSLDESRSPWNSRGAIQTTGILGALAVGLGAFGAHGLKGRVDQGLLEPQLLEAYKTGVQYHFYHTLALMAVAFGSFHACNTTWIRSAVLLWLLGIVLFSGSLYLMTFIGVKALGAITPFGGVCFILGWLALALAAWRAPR